MIRLVFIGYLILIIVAIHLWRLVVNLFVTTQGIIPSIVLIAALLLIAALPYWDSDD